MDFLKKAQLGIKALQLQQNPGKTALIFEIVELASSLKENQSSVEQTEQSLLRDAGFRSMWESKWLPPLPSMEDLERLPKNSLGYAYGNHLKSNNLKLNFFPKPKTDKLIDYLAYRLYRAHDLWHVILGYDTSMTGEIEVQAFTSAQINSPASIFLIAGGLLKILRTQPASAYSAFERVVGAYSLGKRSKFLLSSSLETKLMEDLADVKTQLLSE